MAFPYHSMFPEARIVGKDNYPGFFETKAKRDARVGRLLESVKASAGWKKVEDFMLSRKLWFRLTSFLEHGNIFELGDGIHDYPYVVVKADLPVIAMLDSIRIRRSQDGGVPVVAVPLNVFEYVVEFMEESERIEAVLKKAGKRPLGPDKVPFGSEPVMRFENANGTISTATFRQCLSFERE